MVLCSLHTLSVDLPHQEREQRLAAARSKCVVVHTFCSVIAPRMLGAVQTKKLVADSAALDLGGIQRLIDQDSHMLFFQKPQKSGYMMV